MLRIVTDNASDITIKQAKELDIELVPLEIVFDDGVCPQNTEEDFSLFYERLEKCRRLPVTSRPAPQLFLDIFQDAKEKNDDVLVLTVSGGLSGTIESACAAWRMAEYDRVYIVDTHQAIIAQRLLVEMAVRLREDGYSASEIAQRIEKCRDQVVVCGVVDTLEYLRKGGRIPAGLAAVGKVLRIKPVIVLEDSTLKTIGKARGYMQGIKMLFGRVADDHPNTAYPVYFGYTSNRERGLLFMQKTKEKFSLKQVKLHPVGGVIGTHCGTNCVAVAYIKQP